MLGKLIKFTDYNGVEREEKFYFNISKTELVEKQNEIDGGLQAKIERIIAAQNGPELMKLFREFVDLSYGEKSDDGKYFRKSPEILANFKSTTAYDALIMELLGDETGETVINFMKAIIPSDVADQIDLEKINM